MSETRVIDIEPGDARMAEILPVVQELRPTLTAASLVDTYSHGYPEGLRVTALYLDDLVVAVAGWRIVTTTATGRKLYVDDLVTTADVRSQGLGKHLLDELALRAARAGCTVIDLDSSVVRHDAHRFYVREGFQITAHHFVRELPRTD